MNLNFGGRVRTVRVTTRRSFLPARWPKKKSIQIETVNQLVLASAPTVPPNPRFSTVRSPFNCAPAFILQPRS